MMKKMETVLKSPVLYLLTSDQLHFKAVNVTEISFNAFSTLDSTICSLSYDAPNLITKIIVWLTLALGLKTEQRIAKLLWLVTLG
jgi:hypothetical protein